MSYIKNLCEVASILHVFKNILSPLQLQDAYTKLSDVSAKEHRELESFRHRGDTSASAVAELTALVKEQKGRLTELTKAKQQQSAEYRERVGQLEQHLEEARKRMLQLEMLKQV
jgi:leucine-rich repeat/coiled-coil domain-containing protein 1